MAYIIRHHKEFERPFSNLTQSDKERVVEKLEYLAQNPETIGGPMSNLPPHLRGLHKVRIRDRRLFFWVDHEKKEIVPYDIDRRDKAYKYLYRK